MRNGKDWYKKENGGWGRGNKLGDEKDKEREWGNCGDGRGDEKRNLRKFCRRGGEDCRIKGEDSSKRSRKERKYRIKDWRKIWIEGKIGIFC